jgi:hypothetical protein
MMDRLLEASIWSLAGFVFGWTACLLAAHVVHPQSEKATGMNLSFERVRLALGVLILVLVTVTGIQYYRVTSCQTHYNNQVADALAERAEAQRQETTASLEKLRGQRDFLNVITQTRDPEMSRLATAQYAKSLDDQVQALEKLDRTRRANPIPSAPNCGAF